LRFRGTCFGWGAGKIRNDPLDDSFDRRSGK
jgi:hypothetical protein